MRRMAVLVTLPGLILGTAALLLHLALALAVATLLAGPAPAVGGSRKRPRDAAGVAALLLAPARSLAALAGSAPIRASGNSQVSALAPVVGIAATLAAAALVPSFCTGMLTAPLADLPTILGLLGLARVALLLAGFDAGIAGPGLASVSLAVRTLLVVPACALALFTVALASGSSNLDVVLGDLAAGTGLPGLSAAVLLAVVSLGLAGVAAGIDERGLAEQLAGTDLAMFRFGRALQRLVWLDLVTALLLPRSLPVAQANPLFWLLGLLGWGLRIGAGCFLLAQLQRFVGVRGPQRRELAGIATLLGLLAPLLLLVGRSAE